MGLRTGLCGSDSYSGGGGGGSKGSGRGPREGGREGWALALWVGSAEAHTGCTSQAREGPERAAFPPKAQRPLQEHGSRALRAPSAWAPSHLHPTTYKAPESPRKPFLTASHSCPSAQLT